MEDIQNIANLGISSLVSANLVYYSLYGQQLNFSIPFIFAHFMIDFFYCKPEIKLHHFLGMLIMLFKYVHQVAEVDDALITTTIYQTEISTFFYVFKLWMAKAQPSPAQPSPAQPSPAWAILSKINDLCFFTTFFKYRIYDYYVNIIANPWIYSTLEKYTHNHLSQNLFLYTGLYGLFFLNLYWFSILCKIVSKFIFSAFSPQKIALLTQSITSYTYFFNIPIAGYVYSFLPSEAYLYDMIGILTLSCGSYYYHTKIAKYMNQHDGAIEYTSYSILKPFFMDKVCIHLRSLCCVATSLSGTPMFPILVSVSALYHTIGILNLMNYLYYLKKHDEVIVYSCGNGNGNGHGNKGEISSSTTTSPPPQPTDNSKPFISITNYMVSIPVFMDLLVVGYHSESMTSRIHLYSISAWIAILLQNQPFYEINHVVFHGSLMVQNVFLCLCNRK